MKWREAALFLAIQLIFSATSNAQQIQDTSLDTLLSPLRGRTLRCVNPDWSEAVTSTDDVFFRLLRSTPSSVIEAIASLRPGESLDVTPYATGYNVEVMATLQKAAASRGVFFNVSIFKARPAVGFSTSEGKYRWALGAGGFDCTSSSVLLTRDRTLYMDYLIPTVPYGYIVSAPKPVTMTRTLSDRMTTFLKPFKLELWACIGVSIVVSGLALLFFEGRGGCADFKLPPHHASSRRKWEPRVWQLFTGLYRSFTSFFAYDVLHASHVTGRLYVMAYTLCSLLLVSAYTANLAAFFTQDGRVQDSVRSVDDFPRLDTSACVRNNSLHIAFMASKYPNVRVTATPSTQEALYDAVLAGKCGGAVSTDLHAKYLLGTNEKYCGIELVGQTPSLGYYGITVRKPDSAAAGDSSSATNPLVMALNVLMSEFIESGKATDTMDRHFPLKNDVCRAKAEAESKSQQQDKGLQQLSAMDVSGIFALQAAVLFVCFAVYFADWVSSRPSFGRRWRWLSPGKNGGAELTPSVAHDGGEHGGAAGMRGCGSCTGANEEAPPPLSTADIVVSLKTPNGSSDTEYLGCPRCKIAAQYCREAWRVLEVSPRL